MSMLPSPVRTRLPGVTMRLPPLRVPAELAGDSGCGTTASGFAAARSAPAVSRYAPESATGADSPKVQADSGPPLFVNPSLKEALKMRFPAARSVTFTGEPSAAFQLSRSQTPVGLV